MREGAGAHEAGECLIGCQHPDHAFDGEVLDLISIDVTWDDPEVVALEPAFL
jgi:hypothetical protein